MNPALEGTGPRSRKKKSYSNRARPWGFVDISYV
jgi:hypothetical protein